MKREPVLWLVVAGVLIASWLALPLALQMFDTARADTPPGAFEIGPAWFYGWLMFDGVVTLCFLAVLAIRLLVAAADFVWDRLSRNSN